MENNEKEGAKVGGEMGNKVENLAGVKEKTTLPMRRIIIETNGSDIKIIEAAVAGKLEFVAILQSLINFVNQPDKK